MKNMTEIQEQIDIAERLKLLRNAKGLKQQDMADLLGMSYYTYVKLENASHGITTKNLMKISRVLNISADLLLFGDTGDENINFAEYVQSVKLLSTEGLDLIEDGIILIKKLQGIIQKDKTTEGEACLLM